MLKSILLFILLGLSQPIFSSPNVDSTKLVEALKDIAKLESKVKGQDDKIENIEFLNKVITWVGIPTAALSIILLGWNYFWGIRRKLDEELKAESTKATIKELVEKAIAKESDLKNKPIFVAFNKDTKRQEFVDFLVTQKGFKNVKAFSANENIEINTNDLIIFNNEHGDLSDADIKTIGLRMGNAARFFYFNSTDKRWEDASVKMANFASRRDTLEQRLLETLKN